MAVRGCLELLANLSGTQAVSESVEKVLMLHMKSHIGCRIGRGGVRVQSEL